MYKPPGRWLGRPLKPSRHLPPSTRPPCRRLSRPTDARAAREEGGGRAPSPSSDGIGRRRLSELPWRLWSPRASDPVQRRLDLVCHAACVCMRRWLGDEDGRRLVARHGIRVPRVAGRCLRLQAAEAGVGRTSSLSLPVLRCGDVSGSQARRCSGLQVATCSAGRMGYRGGGGVLAPRWW